MIKVKKLLKSFFSNRIVVFAVVPVCLIGIWILASIIFNNKISFSVILYNHPNTFEENELRSPLLKAKKITGVFTSTDNYLGMVIVSFENFIKPDYRGEDVLSFRIRERGMENWHHFNNYRSGVLENELKFPFGFPVIGSSKGKTYEFEIESLYGNNTNAVSIGDASIKSGHQMSKEEIFGSKTRIVEFVLKKLTTSFTDLDFLLSSFIFLLPFLFYLVWKIYLEKLKSHKSILAIVFIVLLALNILILKEFYFGVYIALLAGWVFTLRLNKYESSVSFLYAFSLLFCWIIALASDIDGDYSKINIWVYTLLVVGTVQTVIEEAYKLKNLVGIKQFLKTFLKFS